MNITILFSQSFKKCEKEENTEKLKLKVLISNMLLFSSC